MDKYGEYVSHSDELSIRCIDAAKFATNGTLLEDVNNVTIT